MSHLQEYKPFTAKAWDHARAEVQRLFGVEILGKIGVIDRNGFLISYSYDAPAQHLTMQVQRAPLFSEGLAVERINTLCAQAMLEGGA